MRRGAPEGGVVLGVEPPSEKVSVSGRIHGARYVPRAGDQSPAHRPGTAASGAESLPAGQLAARARNPVSAQTGTLDELVRVIVRDAVHDALIEHRLDTRAPTESQRPILLTRSAAARALGVSTKTLKSLVEEGLPAVRIGNTHRFDVADALSWLKENRSTRATESD